MCEREKAVLTGSVPPLNLRLIRAKALAGSVNLLANPVHIRKRIRRQVAFMNNLWIQVHLVARLVVVLMDLFYVLFYMRHQRSARKVGCDQRFPTVRICLHE
jgi:hypothetical protein